MTNRLRTAAGAVLVTLALVGSIQLRAVDGEPEGRTLLELIRTAYPAQDKAPRQIVGGPSWMETERFHIEPQALAGGDPAAAGSVATAALRTLLAERFKLTLHAEVAQRPRYALVLSTPAVDLRLQFVGTIVRHPATAAGQAARPDNLFTLMHEPLELTLERRRDLLDIVVIDNAELPSGN